MIILVCIPLNSQRIWGRCVVVYLHSSVVSKIIQSSSEEYLAFTKHFQAL